MQPKSPELPIRLSQWLEKWLLTQGVAKEFEVERLAGDGSTRCFYRVRWPHQTRILLSDPDWIFSKDYAAHQAYLGQCSIPVPRFDSVDSGVGGLIMEDLGDELLQFRLKKEPTRKAAWLEEAILLLARFHGRTFPVPQTLPAASRRFDRQKYFEEMKFTQEHLHQKLLGLAPLGPGALKKLEAFCEAASAVGPNALSHRDYHTRNLLVHKDALFMIDFQDARLGPPHYDLASLLYDAYVPLTDAERTALEKAYRSELSKFPKLYEKINWGSWSEDLARVAFQRVVKAAGSFASFFTRYGKRTHLPYLKPALESARRLRAKFPGITAGGDEAFPLETWIEKSE